MSERARILTVDDTEAKRYAITRILRKAGFEVEEATSGAEALVRAREKPDLIVLDVKLPDINGFEVCRRLRQDPELASIPVLHVSASFTRTADRVTGLEAGADAYMTDPVEPAELVAMVNALLRMRRAEEQARTTARQWQTTFDALRDGVSVTSVEGKILEANRALGELLAMSPEDLRGRLLAHRYREAFDAEPPSILEPGQTEAMSAEIDVGTRWLRVRRDPIRNDAEETVGAVHIIADVTTEKRAEKAEQFAREASALVDVMMENAPAGIGVFDRSLRFLRVNAAFASMTGRSAESHVGLAVADVLPSVADEICRNLQQVLDTGAPLSRDVSGRRGPRDEVRHWFVSYYPLRADGGPVFAVGTMVVDVTERRRIEDRQRFLAEASRILASSLDAEATLKNIAELVVPAIADWCTVDVLENGQIHRIAITHVDPTKLAVVDELRLRWPPDPNAPRGAALVLRTGKSDWASTFDDDQLDAAVIEPERRALMKQLGVRSYMTVPLIARDVVFGVIGFITADSGRRYTADDLAFAEELARRASLAIENARLYAEAQGAVRAREDVLAFVSHDLKNPLTSIVMNATMLKRATPDGAPGEKLRRHSDMIVRAADRMNRLVHDLLDWASLRAGRLSLVAKDVPVATLLQETAGILQPVAAMKEQTFTVEAPPDLVVSGDRDRLLRVLSNLVGNALKYTPEGGTIAVRGTIENDEVVISVTDTGPGIKEDELPHVFDRYFRAKQAGAEGTGLGLAIAKGIVEAHNGRIWAESTVGVGSTFAFALPRRRQTPILSPA